MTTTETAGEGEPTRTGPSPAQLFTTLPERIQTKIQIADCWLWFGCTTADGYGRLTWNRQVHNAHRVVYELLVGPIPTGLQVDHLCFVKNCVNPAHLQPVTQAENRRRWMKTHTHCPHGHEYTPQNTAIMKSSGGRVCRECERLRSIRRRREAKIIREMALCL